MSFQFIFLIVYFIIFYYISDSQKMGGKNKSNISSQIILESIIEDMSWLRKQ